MDQSVEPKPDERAAEAMRAVSRVVVPTTDGDEQLDLARQVTTKLAARQDWQVILYDRSKERWTDTPHPSGPHSTDEIDSDEREFLVRQMRDMEAAGVSVSAWLATVPSISAMVDVLQAVEVDAVVLPKNQGRAKLMDHLLEGDDPAQLVDRVAELQLGASPTFLVVDDDGTITVEEYAP